MDLEALAASAGTLECLWLIPDGRSPAALSALTRLTELVTFPPKGRPASWEDFSGGIASWRRVAGAEVPARPWPIHSIASARRPLAIRCAVGACRAVVRSIMRFSGRGRRRRTLACAAGAPPALCSSGQPPCGSQLWQRIQPRTPQHVMCCAALQVAAAGGHGCYRGQPDLGPKGHAAAAGARPFLPLCSLHPASAMPPLCRLALFPALE